MSGRPARSLWSGRHFTWHINCLEMLAMFRALKHFLPDLRNHHVLVRTDNTAVVSYINHQGGLRSRPLYKLAHQILVWSQDKFLLLSAIYIPGHLNIGADILSRQEPRPGGMESSPQDGEAYLKSFWPDTGGSVCDSSDIALSPLVLSDSYSSTGLDAMVQKWPRLHLYAFSPDRSALGSSRESAPEWGPAVDRLLT